VTSRAPLRRLPLGFAHALLLACCAACTSALQLLAATRVLAQDEAPAGAGSKAPPTRGASEPPGTDRVAIADALFVSARGLMQEHRYPEACAKFQERAPFSGNTQSELDAAIPEMTGSPAGMPAGAVPGAAATEIGLSAQYQINQAARTDYMVAPVVAIRNVSVREGVPLSALKLRYYFTNEYSARCPANCVIEGYYANLSLGAIVDVERRYVQLDGDLACLEFSFENEKAVLRQGEAVQTFQGFHISPYLPFDQSDDYSYDPKQTSFVDSKTLTLYKDGVLVWGAPP
jgi:Cellulose binding domain